MTSDPPISPAHPRARAVTLIEAVLFISVALGLIVGGIVFYQQASEAARVQKQIRVLTAIVAELRAAAKTSGLGGIVNGIGTEANLDEYLALSGALPPDVIRPPSPNGVTLATSWETPLLVSLSPFAAQGEQNPVFTIWLQRLPVAACARLHVVDATGSGVFADGIQRTGVHNVKPFINSQIALVDPPISPDDAATACRAADTDNNGAVALQFEVAAFH